MNTPNRSLNAIPTNIITGFLGVGKTSAIKYLLANKPEHERWAVLVNEFGEIGVDASLIQPNDTSSQDIFVKEVPGGCMCCAAGLPMQVALNQLIARGKPDRLLIEPTGLGHPREVIDVLSNPFNREQLSLGATLTLVDPRKLANPKYTGHDTFNQQIKIADVLIGNKRDLYDDSLEKTLRDCVQSLGLRDTRVVFSEHAKIDISLLALPNKHDITKQNHHHHQASPSQDDDHNDGHDQNHGHEHDHDHEHKHDHDHDDHDHMHQQESGSHKDEAESNISPWLEKAENSGEGYRSIGWRLSAEHWFDYRALKLFLTGLSAERLKAVCITDQGIFGFNLVDGVLNEMEVSEAFESRIEILDTQIEPAWEEALLKAIQGS